MPYGQAPRTMWDFDFDPYREAKDRAAYGYIFKKYHDPRLPDTAPGRFHWNQRQAGVARQTMPKYDPAMLDKARRLRQAGLRI